MWKHQIIKTLKRNLFTPHLFNQVNIDFLITMSCYCPISLLKMEMKILSKVLSNNHKLICHDQSGFVRGWEGYSNPRCLFDMINLKHKEECVDTALNARKELQHGSNKEISQAFYWQRGFGQGCLCSPHQMCTSKHLPAKSDQIQIKILGNGSAFRLGAWLLCNTETALIFFEMAWIFGVMHQKLLFKYY